MRFFRTTNIDFLSIRGYTYFASGLIIFAGMVSLMIKGVNFGIDFRGGTEIVLSFQQPPDVGALRTALGEVGLGKSEIKSFGSPSDILIRTTEQEAGTAIGDRIKQAVRTSFPNAGFEVLKEDKIGPKIGKELRRDALYAVVASLVVILGYVAVRFKFIYGVGGVVALFHDVLVTIGVMSLLDGVFPRLNLEISQEVVAAFLTLVGVSINDTVVVFDRIRENLKIYKTKSLFEVINKSLNDTLSRTIITDGTIIAVTIVLLLAGGEVTRGFAFAMTIGMIAGTYSSVYIASAIVLDWSLRRKKLPE